MSTEVKILGKSYAVRSDGDPRFALEAAEYVDSKMRELAGKSALLQPEKVAVLTAMNLAGDYLKVSRRDESLRRELRSKVAKLLKLLNQHI